MNEFGKRLRQLRKNEGLSQSELASKVGVSKSSINMYERGEREPGFETLEAIADLFNVNVDFLLGIIDCPRFVPADEDIEKDLEARRERVRQLDREIMAREKIIKEAQDAIYRAYSDIGRRIGFDYSSIDKRSINGHDTIDKYSQKIQEDVIAFSKGLSDEELHAFALELARAEANLQKKISELYKRSEKLAKQNQDKGVK